MGRRSRKRYKRPIRRIRRLPKLFQCPACGLPTLSVDIKSQVDEEGFEHKSALIRCLNPKCGLRADMSEIPSVFEAVDVYAKFLDGFTSGEVEVAYEKGEEEGEESQ